MTQKGKILELLNSGDWICTSQMYALYIADVRRRLCDLQKDGHKLESRKCQQHNYHEGGSKEWRLMPQTYAKAETLASSLPDQKPQVQMSLI